MTHALTISAFTTLTSFIIILNDAGRSHVHGYSPGYNNNNHRHHRCRHPTIMSRASLPRANSHDCESLLTHQSSNSQLSRRKSHPSRRGGGGRAKYYYGQVKKDEDYFIHHRLHMRAGNDLNLGSIGGDDSCSTPARKIGSGVCLDAANSSGSPNGGSSIGNVIIGRQDGKRRQAARTVASFFSSFPLLSKSTDATASTKNSRVTVLEQENEILRQTISALEKENQILEKASQTRQRIIVEQFEGEGKPMFDVNGAPIDPTWWEEGEKPIGLRSTSGVLSNETATDNMSSTEEFTSLVGREVNTGASSAVSVVADADECDDYDDGICPVEPDISFKDALKDRAYWLVGLLTLQSMSGFILARNEQLLQTHPVIVYFLTMLVGAGGNAGNQAAVRVIRGIALGTLNENTQRRFLNREFKMAISLSVILSCAGFIRAAAFRTPFPETIAVTTALAIIVFTSICFGAVLPLLLRKLDVDPAHSSTTIQVIMDILGVVLTVVVSTTLLDSAMGQQLISKMSWGG